MAITTGGGVAFDPTQQSALLAQSAGQLGGQIQDALQFRKKQALATGTQLFAQFQANAQAFSPDNPGLYYTTDAGKAELAQIQQAFSLASGRKLTPEQALQVGGGMAAETFRADPSIGMVEEALARRDRGNQVRGVGVGVGATTTPAEKDLSRGGSAAAEPTAPTGPGYTPGTFADVAGAVRTAAEKPDTTGYGTAGGATTAGGGSEAATDWFSRAVGYTAESLKQPKLKDFAQSAMSTFEFVLDPTGRNATARITLPDGSIVAGVFPGSTKPDDVREQFQRQLLNDFYSPETQFGRAFKAYTAVPAPVSKPGITSGPPMQADRAAASGSFAPGFGATPAVPTARPAPVTGPTRVTGVPASTAGAVGGGLMRAVGAGVGQQPSAATGAAPELTAAPEQNRVDATGPVVLDSEIADFKASMQAAFPYASSQSVDALGQIATRQAAPLPKTRGEQRTAEKTVTKFVDATKKADTAVGRIFQALSGGQKPNVTQRELAAISEVASRARTVFDTIDSASPETIARLRREGVAWAERASSEELALAGMSGVADRKLQKELQDAQAQAAILAAAARGGSSEAGALMDQRIKYANSAIDMYKVLLDIVAKDPETKGDFQKGLKKYGAERQVIEGLLTVGFGTPISIQAVTDQQSFMESLQRAAQRLNPFAQPTEYLDAYTRLAPGSSAPAGAAGTPAPAPATSQAAASRDAAMQQLYQTYAGD